MIDQKINDSLKGLEQSLKNIDSARKQVERTVNSYDGLKSTVSELVTELGLLNQEVKELTKEIGKDYDNRITNFEKDRQAIIDSANNASQKLEEATIAFRTSLNSLEKKLNYSLIINVISVIGLATLLFLALK